jgi:hypothetical protein
VAGWHTMLPKKVETMKKRTKRGSADPTNVKEVVVIGAVVGSFALIALAVSHFSEQLYLMCFSELLAAIVYLRMHFRK